MSTAKLETRIAALEAEVAALKAEIGAHSSAAAAGGWRAIVGTMPDDEITRRAERYGREYRASLKPKSKSKQGRKKRAHPRHRSPQSSAAR